MSELMYWIKQAARVTGMIAVSTGLLWLSYWLFHHQSSAAFESGVVTLLVAIGHWAFWPEIQMEKGNE